MLEEAILRHVVTIPRIDGIWGPLSSSLDFVKVYSRSRRKRIPTEEERKRRIMWEDLSMYRKKDGKRIIISGGRECVKGCGEAVGLVADSDLAVLVIDY